MPRRIGLTLEQWPTGDRAVWERALARNDVFDTAAIAGHWREKTQAQTRYAYARWLSYLQTHDPDTLALPLTARVTPEAMQEYVAACEKRLAPMSIAAELQHLSLALRALSPATDWTWLRQLQYAFQKQARPREKRDKIVDPRRLLALGATLMDRAETEARPSEQARGFRDGLLIALLALRPIRRRSLAALQVGRHLHKVAGRYVIELAPEDTKSGHAVEFDVPNTLTARMDAYLTRYRALFREADASSALWLSSKGGALGAEAIYDLVCRRTREAFGTAIHPHLFRDIAVTAIAREAPEALPIARDLLTHARIETTQKFYSRAQTVDAARRHAITLDRLRSQNGCRG